MAEAPDSARTGPGIEVLRTEHAGAAYDEDVSVAGDAIAEDGGLSYIAHFTNGILDFAIARPTALASDSSPSTGRGAGVAFERAGRHFNFMVTHFDNSCRQLESGPLIRVVAQGETGAVYHYLKFPGQNLFGITLDSSEKAVVRADRQMAAVSEAATARLGVQSLDWGGFRVRHSLSGKDEYEGGDSSESKQVTYLQPSDSDFRASPQARLFAEALHPDHLHYVAIFRKGRVAVGADIFEDRALAPFFQKATPELRRVGYGELLRQVELQSDRLRQILETIRSRRLIRLVLDVAQGAIYFMPLGEDDCLVGVTLNQGQVDRADAEFRALYTHLKKSGI